MGPVIGVALTAYFRCLNAAYTGKARLKNIGPEDDSYPADILCGYLAASTVRSLKFGRARYWSGLIETLTDEDLSRIVIDYVVKLDVNTAKKNPQISWQIL